MDLGQGLDIIAKHNDLLSAHPKPSYQRMVDSQATSSVDNYVEKAILRTGALWALVPSIFTFVVFMADTDTGMGLATQIVASALLAVMAGVASGIMGVIHGAHSIESSKKHQAIMQGMKRELAMEAEVEYRTQLDTHLGLREQAQQELQSVLAGTAYTYEIHDNGVKLVKNQSLGAAATPLSIASDTGRA